MYSKLCNIKDYAVYTKDVEPHMNIVGIWKSKRVKVIVAVAKYDAVDKQKCFESFGSLDFEYFETNNIELNK